MRVQWLLAGFILVTGSIASTQAKAQVDVNINVQAPGGDDEGDYGDYGDEAPPPQAVEVEEPAPVEGGDLDDVASFQPALAPYGEWIWVAGVGQVWRPYANVVGDGFRPYATGGHWVYTDVGWTFVSNYPWGWAPFHYGHWWWADGYGWVWLPGRQWAPAWVDWRYGGAYVGWAPMPPPGFTFGVSYGWGSPWCFVETRYVTAPVVTTYVVPVERVRTVYSATQVVPVRAVRTGVSYSAGPPIAHVSAAIGHPVRAVPVAQVARAVPPSTVHLARPVIAARPISPIHPVSQPVVERPGSPRPMVSPRAEERPAPVRQQENWNEARPARANEFERPAYNQPRPEYRAEPQRRNEFERPAYNQPRPTMTPQPQRQRPNQLQNAYHPAQRPLAPPPPRRRGGKRR